MAWAGQRTGSRGHVTGIGRPAGVRRPSLSVGRAFPVGRFASSVGFPRAESGVPAALRVLARALAEFDLLERARLGAEIWRGSLARRSAGAGRMLAFLVHRFLRRAPVQRPGPLVAKGRGFPPPRLPPPGSDAGLRIAPMAACFDSC